MTIDDLMKCPADWVHSEDIAESIGCSPQALRNAAKEAPTSIPWPVLIIGARVYHSRLGYLAAVGATVNG